MPTNKVEVYRVLYRINHAFAFVVERLKKLEPMQIVAPRYIRNFQGYTQELQAKINQELLEELHGIELDAWARFGKIREAEEKRLRDPDDVFIQAEERRKELAKQKSKNEKNRSSKRKQP
jgi:hypothetical protein